MQGGVAAESASFQSLMTEADYKFLDRATSY
jgi:hypothetical protein